jgi:vacuolar protein sorting-associated protein 13A/C
MTDECRPAHGVLFIKYCSVLLQALTIETDEDFLLSLYDLTKIQGASWDAEVVESVVLAVTLLGRY